MRLNKNVGYYSSYATLYIDKARKLLNDYENIQQRKMKHDMETDGLASLNNMMSHLRNASSEDPTILSPIGQNMAEFYDGLTPDQTKKIPGNSKILKFEENYIKVTKDFYESHYNLGDINKYRENNADSPSVIVQYFRVIGTNISKMGRRSPMNYPA